MLNAQGADLSFYDGGPEEVPLMQTVDFTEYGESLAFAVIKVSEGLVEDPLFVRQWGAARGRVIRSAYSFFRSYVNQKVAAQNAVRFLGNDGGELPASLDLEAADGSTSVMSLAHQWVDEYQRLTGRWPMIYSTRGFLAENGASAKTIGGVFKNAWLKVCPLWLAEWPFDELDSLAGYVERGDALRKVLIQEVIDGKRQLKWPSPIEPWDHVEIFQWTSRYPPEAVPGYYLGPNHKEAVDMNFHIRTRAALDALYSISPAPTPEPEPIPEPVPTPGGNMQYKVIWPDGANVRPEPSTTNNAVRILALGAVVDVVQDGIPDEDNPTDTTKLWVKLADGKFAASEYGNGTARSVRMTKVGAVTPPPATDHVVTVQVSADVDGVPYVSDIIPLHKA